MTKETATRKGLAKSLHTVSVIARLARHLAAGNPALHRASVEHALEILGYDGAPDPYGLAAIALAQLNAGK